MAYLKPRPSKAAFKVKRGLAGLGLAATGIIKRSEFIIEYYGPLLTNKEFEARGDGKYFFDVGKKYTIDGSVRYNIARYLNHSCDPNCYSEQEGTRIFIYARRKIEAGEELTYDYGKEYVEEYISPYGCRCASCAAS